LESVTCDRGGGISRLALWNSVFPWVPVRVNTDIRLHLAMRLFAYHSDHNTALLAFELAVLFIDIPEVLERLLSVFPLPIRIAVHIAHATLLNHVERPSREELAGIVDSVWCTLREERRPAFLALARALRDKGTELDSLVEPFEDNEAVLDSILALLPPLPRLRLALKYGRQIPRISLDFNHLNMPLEFLQAVADMDGVEATWPLIDPAGEEASEPVPKVDHFSIV
jgi:hypothetical protein